MPKLLNLDSEKTYATKANAQKAVDKLLGNEHYNSQRYFIMQNDAGRFFPVFVGERACQEGIHFHFTVVM